MKTEEEFSRVNRRKKKAKKSRKRKIAVCAVILVIAICAGIFGMSKFVDYLISRPTTEAATPSEVGGIPVIVDLLPEGIPGRCGQLMKIKHIVIHETGNSGSNSNAAAHDSYLHKEAQNIPLSWHYTVDDREIYKHLPDNEVGFHAGDGYKPDGGNMNGIGIEMCVNPENDYEQTLRNTAFLVKHLMKEYNLKIDDVKKHQDFSGKVCPENLILSDRWDDFLKLVEDAD